MKNLVLILLISGMPLMGYGQSNAVLEFHNKYKDNSRYLSFRIEGGLLKTLSNIETDDPEAGDFLKLISKIDAIDIHSINLEESKFDERSLQEFIRQIKREKFEDLMIVNEENKKINFLVKESGGRISDLLLLIDAPDDFTVLNISGDIDLHSLAKLSRSMDFKGSEELRKLDKDN